MENVYAGYCSERCRVLCTIELGLVFSRRLSEDEDEDEESMGMGCLSRAPVGTRSGRARCGWSQWEQM